MYYCQHWQRQVYRFALLLTLLHVATALENGLSRTPHRGWSSWNKLKCNVNNGSSGLSETTIVDVAIHIKSSGLAAAGYDIVALDDCYLGKERVDGKLVGGPTFPSGLKALGNKLHAMALKFGVYLDSGDETCGKYPGSRNSEQLDAATIASWGADYMKYDECNTPVDEELFRFFTMRDALNRTGRPIIYTICPIQSRCDGTVGQWWHNSGGQPAPAMSTSLTRGEFWDASSVANANMCRGDGFLSCDKNHSLPCSNYCGKAHCTASASSYRSRRQWGAGAQRPRDIAANFCSFNCLLDANIAFDSGAVSGPGHWTISDMLEVGNGMSTAEDESHFTLWCLMSFPLMMGHDVRTQSSDTLRILTNRELLAVSADPMGRAAKLLGGVGAIRSPTQVYLKQLADGDYVAALYQAGRQNTDEYE